MRPGHMVGVMLAVICQSHCTSPSTAAREQARTVSAAPGQPGSTGAGQEMAAERRGRAFALLRAKKYPEALECFDLVLASNPGDAGIHYGKANVLALMGRKAAAVDSLRQALAAGFTEVVRLIQDPGMLELRGEAAFQAILAAFEVVLAEEQAPRLENIQRILAEPRFHPFIPRLLPRYCSRDLTEKTRSLLENQDSRLVRVAIVSLLHQNADDETTRSRIQALLSSADVEVREVAAEYFLWHGGESDRGALAGAIAMEQDPFVLASERAALELIGTRARWASPPTAHQPLPKETSHREALRLLRARSTAEVLQQVAEFYRLAWPFDPKLMYGGMNADATLLAEQHDRFNLAAAMFGFSRKPSPGQGDSSAVLPTALSFMAPVRNYFHPGRQSFGATMGAGGPFAHAVHCGDDVAWQADEAPVVAVADGIVRLVSLTYSWGFLVVVEHRLPMQEGYACSLYAHLAPSLSVATGQVVRKGQRIGSVGRSYTWENGGYLAHLHFGLHRGPYLQSRPSGDASPQGPAPRPGSDPIRLPAEPEAFWITGYLRPARWAAGRHGWENPQAFIGKRLEAGGDSK